MNVSTSETNGLICRHCHKCVRETWRRMGDVSMCIACWDVFDEESREWNREWNNGKNAAERGELCPEGASVSFELGFGKEYTYEEKQTGQAVEQELSANHGHI